MEKVNGFNDYQDKANKTAIYKDSLKVIYPTIGLAGEVGEISEKVKKHLRDDKPLDKEDLTKELGDVLWYVSTLARDLGINLQDVADTNIDKLKSRQQRGKLGGSGDNR